MKIFLETVDTQQRVYLGVYGVAVLDILLGIAPRMQMKNAHPPYRSHTSKHRSLPFDVNSKLVNIYEPCTHLNDEYNNVSNISPMSFRGTLQVI